MSGKFALFAEGTLHNAVAARSLFEEAMSRAAIEIPSVPIIALLRGHKGPVAATSDRLAEEHGFEAASAVAAVAIRDVSVVTLFTGILESVSAFRGGGNLLPPAKRGTAVAIQQIAVIAFFAHIQHIVPATIDPLPPAEGIAAIPGTDVSVITLFK